jgi:hypothetical protein
MASHENSIVINAPVSEVFAYVNAPATIPDWMTGMIEVRNVIGSGAGQQYDWTQPAGHQNFALEPERDTRRLRTTRLLNEPFEKGDCPLLPDLNGGGAVFGDWEDGVPAGSENRLREGE